jgi:hypothetical protein
MRSFWDARAVWEPTWTAGGPDSAALVVDSVRVWQDEAGADGSSASGDWLAYVAADGGPTVLPPSYAQAVGTVMGGGWGGWGGGGAAAAAAAAAAAGPSIFAAEPSMGACGDVGAQRIRLALQLNVSRDGDGDGGGAGG